MPQGQSRPSLSKWPDTYPTPAWQVAGGTNPLMSFPLNCSQGFSVPLRSFRAQQRLGRLLATWSGKGLRFVRGRPLIIMMHNVWPAGQTLCIIIIRPATSRHVAHDVQEENDY